MKELTKSTDKNRLTITTGSWVRAVLVIALAYFLFLIRDITLVVLASIIIASAVEPAATWGKKRHLPRLPTILSVYVILATIFAGLFYYLFIPLIGEMSNFIVNLPDYASTFDSSTSFFGDSFSMANIADQLNVLLNSFSKGIISSASFFFGGITSFILIVILSFYLAVQEDGVGKFLRIITPWKHEHYIVDLWSRSRQKIGFWMQGQLLLVAIIAVLVYLGLLLLQVPNALLLAVTAGLFEIIPLFGPIIAAIPAILIAFVEGGPSLALLVAGLFIIIQQFENQLIYPLVVKKVIGVPPMVSILALLVGAKIAGFLGILIAVPLAAILMELVSDLEKEKSARVEAVIESETP